MSSHIPETLRRFVAVRANFLCEYCLIHETDTFLKCEVDHIISLKHKGPTHADNLAYACFICNRLKGSDVGSLLWETNQFVRFFNPRLDRWGDHFQFKEGAIHPLSDIGKVTAHILRFNDSERILERETLMLRGKYPSPAAQERMRQ